jgi:lipopolysaccharide transport system ATP-binding protein
MSSEAAVIRVDGLSKCHLIYEKPAHRLQQFILPRLARAFGRSPRARYREFWALRDVSFEVGKSQTVGVVGRNGSGKSTLLQLICGTQSPTSGQVRTHGRVAALLELGSGFNPEFTGRENVYLSAALLGLTKDEIGRRFDEIASFADIGDFIDQPVKVYSTGMFVRLAFAVQAMVDPDILIVDEALSVGDEKFQRKCFARIEQLRRNGTSILFVSHAASTVLELCDRALLLDQGTRLMFGSAKDVIRAYQSLIYAPPDRQARLAREYREADRGEAAPSTADPGPLAFGAASQADGEDFDPSLVPDTTSVYPVQGAQIESFIIRDPAGRAVNVLRTGRDYRFEIAGRFAADCEDVYFGMHIRTISGLEISGQRQPVPGRFLARAAAGQRFKATFGIRMLLTPGVYFAGGGVWSGPQATCLHRIVDALMFRVVELEPSHAFGYCDLGSTEPTAEVGA